MTARLLDPVHLRVSLLVAQQALLAAGPGVQHEWVLPAGSFTLDGAVELGADGVVLTVRGQDTELLIVPVPGGTEEVRALALRGRTVVLERVAVRCPPVTGALAGVALAGEDYAAARGVRVGELTAGTATGLRVRAGHAVLDDCAVTGIRATLGVATGIEAVGTAGGAGERRVDAAGLAVTEVHGPGVRGLLVDAPAGAVTGAELSGVAALADAPDGLPDLALDVAEDVPLSGVTVHRALPDAAAGTDLAATLAAAQQRLLAAPAGLAETWQLPAGTFTLPEPLSLGAPGRELTVRGADTELSLGVDAAVPGDLVALALSGARVRLAGVTVRARCTGSLVAVRVHAEHVAGLQDVAVAQAEGADVLAVDVQAPDADLLGVTVTVTQATGPATGIAVAGDGVALAGIEVHGLTGQAVTGVDVHAGGQAALTRLRVAELSGTSVRGVSLHQPGSADPAAEASLLDLVLTGLRASDGEAAGLIAYCGGDLALRGITVSTVEGQAATGVLAVAGTELDWLGGGVHDIAGSTRGACGARLCALPSRAAVSVREVAVLAVHAPVVGTAAEPADSWRSWLTAMRQWLLTGDGAPPAVTDEAGHHDEVAGLHVCAPVPDDEPWLANTGPDAGEVALAQCVLRRISGTALQVNAELRDVEVRGTQVWTALRASWLGGERVLLANLTVHRVGTGLELGPCAPDMVNSLVTGVQNGAGVLPGPHTPLGTVAAAFSAGAVPPFTEPPADPYRLPGPDTLPPGMDTGALAQDVPVDLALADDALHRRAVRVPGDPDDAATFLGAEPPAAHLGCTPRDPEPPAPDAVIPASRQGPPVDYRARDARSLLALMADRTRRVLPGWAPSGPADHTTMWQELLAERLDRLAYRQEVAVAEGYLGTASTRRSVTDHARLVDYRADAGLSATAMLRFTVHPDGLTALGLDGRVEQTGALVVPAGTLVANAAADERLVVFGTEADLPVDPGLDELRLAEPVRRGSCVAVLAGDAVTLRPGRWLVLLAVDAENPAIADPDVAGHVVRVTAVELGGDVTRVGWDPRRPSPAEFGVDTARVYGNVVPAHHGLPLTPVSAQGAAALLDTEDVLRPWRERLSVRVPPGAREMTLPWAPVSVHAAGWPLPGRAPREGTVQLRLSVDGEPWTPVDDLSTMDPSAEVFALRPGSAGEVLLTVGDGVNGAQLPDREAAAEIGVRIGLGAVGNVAAETMVRLLALGAGGDAALILGDGGIDRFDAIRRHLLVTNPVAAAGGRDPEPVERIRYAAPLGVRDLLCAVVPADYERLLTELPEVAAARVSVLDTDTRPLVRATLLLRDEDELTGDAGDAERLRRWAVARARLEQVRLLGHDVELLPPRFVPMLLSIVVRVADRAVAETVRADVTAALSGAGGLLDPDTGGLGGAVHLDAVHRATLAVPGVAAVRVRALRRLVAESVVDGPLLAVSTVDATVTGSVALAADEVAVLRHPYGPDFPQGLLIVRTTGGLT